MASNNTDDEASAPVAMDAMVKMEDPLANLDDNDYHSEDGSHTVDEEGDNADTTRADGDFNGFHEFIQTLDPALLWSLVQAKVVPHVPIWEFVCDKALNSEPEPEEDDENDPKDADYRTRKLQTHRLKVMLEQMGEVVIEMGKMVSNCCIDADTPDPPKNPKVAKRILKTDEEELFLSVNKTLNRVLHNKIPNTSGNGFKLKRDIPEQYSDIFYVEVPAEDDQEDEDISVNEDKAGNLVNESPSNFEYDMDIKRNSNDEKSDILRCKICARTFKEFSDKDETKASNVARRLLNHRRTCKGPPKPPEEMICKFCHKVFDKRKSFLRHVRHKGCTSKQGLRRDR